MPTTNRMRPVHPGEILRSELDELGLSANALAKALAVPTNRITAILKGQRGVTADTALRLSCYFGTTPQFWLNLQKTFELRVAEIRSGQDIAERVRPRVPSPAARSPPTRKHIENLSGASSPKPSYPATGITGHPQQSGVGAVREPPLPGCLKILTCGLPGFQDYICPTPIGPGY